ncbi:response regulator transcription factor [Longimicrobium sp.]|jgi:DNA-binding response OmpR family regulator|uniref:response regulator transcription factor n=1 Tax=Longimicrobium sp. TaxID=2029185 RepID=UPI002EDB737C
MSRILVVEDNANMRLGLRRILELEGHEVVEAADGPSGLELGRVCGADLIVLDLMLPGFGGHRILRTLREEGSAVPVLILTAQGEEMDKVQGLQLGADDYVTKPFGRHELAARVAALLRRAQRDAPPAAPAGARRPAPERFGRVELRRDARAVTCDGVPVELAPREYDLLIALIDRGGAVVTRLELLREVWGHSAAVLTRTVDYHVAELRRKLEEDPARPRHILTVRKAGYRFACE